MAQDIRELLKNYEHTKVKMPTNHEKRFEAKLNEAFSEERNNTEKSMAGYSWLRIAAMVLVILSVGLFGYNQLTQLKNTNNNEVVATPTQELPKQNQNQIRLGDLSPDLKKVENFYLTGINVQLASLEINDNNKELIDGYMTRLSELDKEYQKLNTELNEVGPNEATVTALIDNLKLRLELLFKLKNKLKELKNENDEQFSSIQT